MLRFRFPKSNGRASAPLAAFAVAFALVALPSAPARAQDDDLEKLLDRVGGVDEPAPAPEGGRADDPPAKPGTGALDDKDAEIDKLLEKFLGGEDAPETKDEPRNPLQPGAGRGQPATKPGEADQLNPDDQRLDQRLEEILGRRRKRDDQPSDPQSGQMAEMIKRMRQAQEKLEQPDTGEETQEIQREILKQIETALRQARQSSSSSRQRRMTPEEMAQLAQLQQQGNDPEGRGTTPGAAEKPNFNNRSDLAKIKDEWGHLPPELRQEMNNIFKEEMLESRKALIERYYLSVARKSRSNPQQP